MPTPITTQQTNTPFTSVVGGWIVAVKRALDEMDIDCTEYLKELKIDLQSGVEDKRFSASQTRQIWQWALANSGRHDIGLLAGNEVGPTTFHALGFSLWASPSFLMALHRMVRFQILLNDGCELTLEQQANNHYLFSIKPKHIDQQALVTAEGVDYFSAAVVKVFRDLCGHNDSHPVSVRLTRPQPSDPTLWLDYFQCPVTFDCTDNCIEFSASIKQPLSTASPLLAEQNDLLVEQYLARNLEQDLVTQVRNTLIETMPQGLTTAQQIAPMLNMSERNLRYELSKKDTNLQAIRDDIRVELSQHYLLFTQLSFTQIAYTLGFSDPAHFNRACKRWTGQSPSQVRKQQG